MIQAMDGYKTYAVAVVTGIVAVADALGYAIPPEAYAALVAVLALTLRHAIGKHDMTLVNKQLAEAKDEAAYYKQAFQKFKDSK